MLLVVVFNLQAEYFGTDIMSIREVIRIPEPVKILQSTRSCVGKLGDYLLQLIDSRKMLEKDEQLSILNS
jgi:chemotaxis signal transduction protein